MKRVFDLVVSLVALAALLPLLLVVAVLIRFKLGSPVIFRQPRLGQGGKVFHVQKFRTMTDECGDDGELLPDADRLTDFGRLLRSLSLDELPTLLNVINGDMSLVGPRPLLAKYRDLYSAEQFRRHEVRPGVTGWAQVNGRNNLSWEGKFRLDVWYVDHGNFWLDLRILLLTVVQVLRRKDINNDEHATMDEFRGSGGDR